ncbi:MAG: Rrf2 family transcriptional regulator [Candidatus Riflebacteria bacterium]|nr:Rrf2 family transcriptional regulator [Candidatus Riflebacteria bacterium]
MSEIINVSDAVNLAIHSLIEIAINQGRAVQTNEIAEKFSVSEAHLSKVLQRLRKAGYVEAERGPKGGYRLLKDPAEIKLDDIFSVIDGPIQIPFCLFKRKSCERVNCKLAGKIRAFSNEILDFLKSNTLADIIAK